MVSLFHANGCYFYKFICNECERLILQCRKQGRQACGPNDASRRLAHGMFFPASIHTQYFKYHIRNNFTEDSYMPRCTVALTPKLSIMTTARQPRARTHTHFDRSPT